MPILDNPKQEAFAQALARGVKQLKAYANAGYTSNASAASKLAATAIIQNRVSELKEEMHARMNALAKCPNEENLESLQEMGLTMEWCAVQFREIYTQALADGQYAPANAAVNSILKLIEVKSAGTPDEKTSDENMIKISEVSQMLDSLKGVIDSAKSEGPKEIETPPAPVDITPDGILESARMVEHSNDNT